MHLIYWTINPIDEVFFLSKFTIKEKRMAISNSKFGKTFLEKRGGK